MKAKKGKKDVNKAMQREGSSVGNRFKSRINVFNTTLLKSVVGKSFATKMLFSLTFIGLIFFYFAVMAVGITSANGATNATPPISEITSPMFLTLIGVIAIILWLPFFILFCALRDKEKWKDSPLALPKGSVRALLAFSLVVLIAIMLVLFRCFNEIISALLALLASIVGYYFGQRSVGAEPKPKTEAEEIEEKAEDYLDEMKKI